MQRDSLQRRQPSKEASPLLQNRNTNNDDPNQAKPATLPGQVPSSAPYETNANDDNSSRGDDDEELVAGSNNNESSSAIARGAVQQATALDVYGWEQSHALGRRSFGGFQPVTAENWYHQQQERQGRALSHNRNDNNSGSKKRNQRKQQPHQPNKNDKKRVQISGGSRPNTKGAMERREKIMDDMMKR